MIWRFYRFFHHFCVDISTMRCGIREICMIRARWKTKHSKKTGHSSMHADCIWLLENWGNYINGSNWIRNIPSGWSRTEWSARDFLEHELIPPKFIGIFIVQRRCRDFDQIEQTNVGILECIYQLKAWRQK